MLAMRAEPHLRGLLLAQHAQQRRVVLARLAHLQEQVLRAAACGSVTGYVIRCKPLGSRQQVFCRVFLLVMTLRLAHLQKQSPTHVPLQASAVCLSVSLAATLEVICDEACTCW